MFKGGYGEEKALVISVPISEHTFTCLLNSVVSVPVEWQLHEEEDHVLLKICTNTTVPGTE